MADAYIEKGTTYEIDGKVFECLEFFTSPRQGTAWQARTMPMFTGPGLTIPG